jgi:putative hemolysin
MNYEIPLLIVLLGLSGFFSGVETALMSVSNVRARQLYEKKRKGSKYLKELKDDPHRLIITLLLGNNLVNIGASALATSIAIQQFGNYGVGIATGAMTFMILVFGEICPKGIAINNADKIALFVAPTILFLRKLFFPIVFLLDFLTQLIINIFSGKKGQEPLVTEEELRDIVMIGEKEGSINPHEKNMIDNIFELDDTLAEQIMTPRTDMFALSSKSKVGDVIEDMLKEGFTRVPVFDKTRDNIIGIVHLAQIFDHVNKNKLKVKLKTIVKPAKFVPETKKVDELLREFQKEKGHMAIVVDEFGGVSGLITLEDLLEEIVGEIYDEDEQQEVFIEKKGKHEYFISGEAEIDDVMEITHIELDVSEKVNTLGGFILEQLGKIPKRGEKLEFENFDLIVQKLQKHRIKEIRLIKK